MTLIFSAGLVKNKFMNEHTHYSIKNIDELKKNTVRINRYMNF